MTMSNDNRVSEFEVWKEKGREKGDLKRKGHLIPQ